MPSFGTAMRATVAALFLAPALVLNAGGRARQLWEGGISDIEPLATLLFVIMSVILLGLCGVAVSKARTRKAQIGIGIVGVAFVAINFVFALEVVSHARDASSDPRRHTIARAADLQNDLRRAREARVRLSHPPVWATAETVQAAKGAVESAETARKQECGKVGDNCRNRVAELSERQTELGKLMASKAATDLITTADDKIAAIEAEIAKLGPIPAYVDPGSARMAKLARISEATVSELLPIIIAAFFELMALVAPRIAMIAMEPARREELPANAANVEVSVIAPPLPSGEVSTQNPYPSAGEVMAIPAPAEPPQRPITRPRPKLAVENKRPVGAILDFLSDGVEFTTGPRTEMAQAYVGYSAWCKATGHRAMDVPQFVEAIETACQQFGIRIDAQGDDTHLVNVQLINKTVMTVDNDA